MLDCLICVIPLTLKNLINPFKPNEPSDIISRTSPFFIFRVVEGIFSLIKKNILKANIEDPDQTPHYAVSDLDMHYLPMSHKNEAWLMWVTLQNCSSLTVWKPSKQLHF